MTLDMTGPARNRTTVHYRRYLNTAGQIVAICVQDFDYPDYDPARFLDYEAFDTQAEAEYTPLRAGDAYIQGREHRHDPVAVRQAALLLDAIEDHARRTEPTSALACMLTGEAS